MEEQNTIDQPAPVKVSPLPIAVRYGAIGGFIMIIISLILYFLGETNNQALSYLSLFVVVSTTIFLGLKDHRDNNLGGYMKYGAGVGTGTLISVFIGLIAAIYTFIFLQFIDPEIMQEALNEAREKMIEQGQSDEVIEQAMDITKIFTSPGVMAGMVVFMYPFFGVILSLIISAIVQKK